MKSILFTFTFCFLTLVVSTQNVGINTLNPLEDLHVRADSSQIAIRMDNKKSVMGGTNYFSAIGIPSSVQVGFYNNPNYQNWTDLVHSKIVDSDNVRLNSPEIAIWPDAANSFRINFNFSPSIPSNATILDMTFHAEWRRIGTYAGEMHIGNTGLYKASNNLKLIDYGFERITNSTDLVITMPVKEIVNQVTPDMINLSDCYIMFNILTSVINGLSRLEIDKAWIEVVYSLPASGSENVSWSTGIVNGKYIISNSGDLGTNQHLTIDEAGIVQVKGLKMTKSAGAGKVMTSNNDGKAFWADLPILSDQILWLPKQDTAYYATGPVQINNMAGAPAIIFDKGESRINNGINMLETDNRLLNIIIDSDNDQINEQFNIYKDSTAFQSQNPAVRMNLGGNDSWINGGGKLGINITTPQTELSVKGTLRAANDIAETEYIEMKHGGNHAFINTVGDGKLVVQHDGMQKLVVQDDGNVGIGVFDPTEKLDINGAIKMGTTTNQSPAAGTIRWNSISGLFEGFDGTNWRSFMTLTDADGDTKVEVENFPDEDIIRFNTGGNSVWSIKNHQLRSNNNNIALGTGTLQNLTTGINNIGIGVRTLFNTTTKNNNIAIGDSCLFQNNGTGFNQSEKNLAIGNGVLKSNTIGTGNIGIGHQALTKNIDGILNLSIGLESMTNNTSGDENHAIGYRALYKNVIGNSNTAFGRIALEENISGSYNVAIGARALNNNNSGYRNVGVGYNALDGITSGFYNTGIGSDVSINTSNENSTVIGYNASLAVSDVVRLGNSSVSTIGGYSNWTNVSDARIKTNIQENVIGLDFINKLRPVTYHLDMDAIANIIGTPDSLRLLNSEAKKSSELQIGFIAQEVEQSANELNFDFHGVYKPQNQRDHYGIRYAEFVAPMVKAIQELSESNEFLLKKLNELQAEIDILKQER